MVTNQITLNFITNETHSVDTVQIMEMSLWWLLEQYFAIVLTKLSWCVLVQSGPSSGMQYLQTILHFDLTSLVMKFSFPAFLYAITRSWSGASLVPRRLKNRRECLVHTVCTCAAPQVFLGNLETSVKSTLLH